MKDKSAELVADFKANGWETPNLYQRLFDLAEDANDIYAFCQLFLTNIDKSATIFNDALSYVKKEQFAELIALSLNLLKDAENKNAAEVIEYAALQFPELLHEHLELIFELKPNESTFYSEYPWRNLSPEKIEPFKERLQNPETSQADKKKLFHCLLETRHLPAVKFAYQHARETGLVKEEFLIYYLEIVGYTLRDGEIADYCPSKTYHFCFPENYFAETKAIHLSKTQHPTWRLKPSTPHYAFGGAMDEHESNPFMHLITLDAIPPGIQILNMDGITLGLHIRELNEYGTVFYQHDHLGIPHKIGNLKAIEYAEDLPIAPTKVAFSETPERWKLQCWGSSNSRENLFRLGGEPTWIQGAEVLTCPICHEKMDFLMQLDTDLPDTENGEVYFGSGGICYVFWCNTSKVSGYLMQCT